MTEAAYPHPADASVTLRMRRNPRFNTRAELRLRSELYARGIRYRVHHLISVQSIRVRPDLAFLGCRLAVFVDGCFWHACPTHGVAPRHNVEYWRNKFLRNVDRDRRVNDALIQHGWSILRIWEHVPSAGAATAVIWALEGRGRPTRGEFFRIDELTPGPADPGQMAASLDSDLNVSAMTSTRS